MKYVFISFGVERIILLAVTIQKGCVQHQMLVLIILLYCIVGSEDCKLIKIYYICQNDKEKLTVFSFSSRLLEVQSSCLQICVRILL